MITSPYHVIKHGISPQQSTRPTSTKRTSNIASLPDQIKKEICVVEKRLITRIYKQKIENHGSNICGPCGMKPAFHEVRGDDHDNIMW